MRKDHPLEHTTVLPKYSFFNLVVFIVLITIFVTKCKASIETDEDKIQDNRDITLNLVS